jgi:SAM-dependent methyltransferase
VTTINQTQRDTWNGESGHRWVADADRRDAVLAPIADTLLAAAHIQPGESVLDLGCGCGATTITVATQAGPGGTAHGIDLSEPMLAVARHRARDPLQCRPPPCPERCLLRDARLARIAWPGRSQIKRDLPGAQGGFRAHVRTVASAA